MHTPRTLITVAGLALVLTLSSCGDSDGDEASANPSSDASGGTSEDGQAGTEVDYQDTVETRRADLGAIVLEEELSGAAEADEKLALDVTVQRVGDAIEQDVSQRDGDIALAFVGDEDDVAYEIVGTPQTFGGEELGDQVSLRGEFSIEAAESDEGDPVYTLTRSGGVESTTRKGAEVCQSDGVDGEATEAAEALQDVSREKYADLRDEWAASPSVWGAIKEHAATGEGAEDEILSEVCAPVRE